MLPSSFGQLPFLVNFAHGTLQLRHTHETRWPVSRVLVALSFKIFVVEQTARFYLVFWEFYLEQFLFRRQDLNYVLLPV